MNEQTKTKIIEAIENLEYGQVIVNVSMGRVVNVSVQTSLKFDEKMLDKM